MTLNIFSLTITITKRESTFKKTFHNENVKKIFEEHRRKAENHIRIRNY